MVSPCLGGAQLAVDTTLVSPLHCDGSPHPGAANVAGAVLAAARRRKERTYPELSGPRSRARLVVLAGEIGGRWSEETRRFLSLLAKAKSSHYSPDPRQDQCVQGVPRACKEASGQGRCGDCQSSRAEVDLRWGGRGRRETVAGNYSWRRHKLQFLRRRLGAELMRASQSRKHSGQWCADGPPSVKDVPPIPQDCAELEGWISDRNCDLRNALEFGNNGDHHTVGNSVESRHRTVVARLERCCDGRAVKVIIGGVDDRRVRRQAQVGCTLAQFPLCSLQCWESSVRVRPVWVVPLHSMPAHHRQCEGLPVVTRDSRYGYRGVRIGEASNPGPPRTRARARMERGG